VADPPEPGGRLPPTLDTDRHLHLHGRRHQPWLRRIAITLMTVLLAVALTGAFGQRDKVSHASTPDATLAVHAPDRVRGGIFYQGRIDVRALRDLKHPTLVFGTGWTEQMQLNTIEPSPDAEDAPDGRLHLGYGELKPGDTLRVWLQLEVNPVSVGRRDQSVELWDGQTVITRVARRVTIFF
jgi:hypothetical protein